MGEVKNRQILPGGIGAVPGLGRADYFSTTYRPRLGCASVDACAYIDRSTQNAPRAVSGVLRL